jgi:hypothetical protein
VIQIFQFIAPYGISDITDVMLTKMISAIAAVLNVETSSVILTFAPFHPGRRHLLQQKSYVVVSVGLRNFNQPAGEFASRMTQDNLNLNMGKVGLEQVYINSLQMTTATGK